MEFYKILQEIMAEKDLTVSETARICNLPDGTIRSILVRQSKYVSLEVAFKISSGLHVSLERLNGEPERRNSLRISPDAMQLAQDYDGLDRHGRRMVRLVADEEKARCTEQASVTETTTPDTSGREWTEPDIAAELAELKRQNQELAAKVAAMEEEDARMEAAAELSPGKPFSGDAKTG